MAGGAGLGPVAWGGPAALSAQEPAPLEHVATFPESFGLLQTVRPLPDGRVIVADPLGQVLAAADPATGVLEPIGREGGGPGEWRQPDAVYALPGDSTLLVDLGNARLAVIDPEGRIVDSHSLTLETGIGPVGMDIIQPGGTDAAGRIYFRARGGMGGPGGPGGGVGASDSSVVKRWERGATTARRVIGLRPPAVRRTVAGGGNERSVRIRPVPLAPEDDWAVAPDGRVAVIRAEPYRVEWIGPEGRVLQGGSMTVRPVPVGQAEKDRYLEEAAARGLSVGVTVENGVRSVQMRRGGRPPGADGADAYEWPEHLPAIRSGGAAVAPDGRLWVERYGAAGAATVYDLFDGRPVRVARVRLPAGQRVVGFGPGVVYAVRTDELGLNWLEIYRAPAGG